MNHKYQGPSILPKSMAFALLLTLALLACPAEVGGEAYDQALFKPVEALVTCGTGGGITSELYYNHSELFQDSTERVNKICTKDLHPAMDMVDGDDNTWWQSTSLPNLLSENYGIDGNAEAIITVHLEQTFAVDVIRLKMGDSKRPGRIQVEKSVDGSAFDPWLHLATTDCALEFGIPLLSMPRTVDAVLCQLYPNAALNKFEVITFDIPTLTHDLLPFLSATDVKFKFYDMDLTMGINGAKFQHFTVVSINMYANCTCSGHETDCQQSEDTGQYTCVCGGNTQGLFCEECLPYYNHQPYQVGVDCVKCNCFNHSEVCEYNAMVGMNKMSIGATGSYDGGGMCVDCRDNTAGLNCETCQDFFYNPVGIDQESQSACVACDCEAAGVTQNPETRLTGDCVKSENGINPPGMVPGDCFCKTNVEGPRCDTCKSGFFNLHPDDPNGCEPCYCDVDGTVGMSFECEPTGDGQCQCKTFVTNRQCSECMDGYWGLSGNNTDGCSPCDCDVGGSTTTACNKDTGQCTCRSNVGGRACDTPYEGYYVPGLHYISGQFEEVGDNWHNDTDGFVSIGYALLQQNDTKSTRIPIPTGTSFSGNYFLVIRYNANAAATATVTVDAVRIASDGTFSETLPACNTPWCFQQVGQASSTQFALIAGESTSVSVELSSPGSLELDEAVFVPAEFVDPSGFLGDNTQTFQEKCNVITNTFADQPYCESAVFSLMARYLGGALRCNCGILGTNTTQPCDPVGGQCNCKPGVGGQNCDECLPGYFRLTNAGCEACGCAGAIVTCNIITGQCDCPPHATGRMCDECESNYWNWVIDVGCESCDCDMTGSRNLQCDLLSGECSCKSGIGGMKCDSCLDGYKLFSATGCHPCGCQEAGSLTTVCNPETGQCPCKNNTQGLLCHECIANSFNLQADYAYGCQSCVCMGITPDCSATTLRINTVALPVSGSGGAINFMLVVGLDATVSSTEVIVTKVDMVDVLQATLTVFTTFYWQPVGQDLTGNLIAMFGLTISFDVYFPSPASGTLRTQRLVIFGFNNTRFFLPTTPEVPDNALTAVSVTISDSYATSDADGAMPVTRGELLLGLTDVSHILLPATRYSEVVHQSFIGNVRYEIASSSGLGSTANSVEQCSCGAGYLGLSCETCADGFRREQVDTHEFLGMCVGCECNGHASRCDSATGECLSCQHQTTGFHCEACQDGYYGDATLGTPVDCQQCPCIPPRVINSTCELDGTNARCSFCMEGYSGSLCDQCDTFYYGNPEVPETGTCTLCFCNGNSDTCDPTTGGCVNCTSNTTGFNCEHCEDTTFGNATTQSCAACGCEPVGSTSDVCDIVSGNCSCHPGVGGQTCDACITDYYGYGNDTFAGCAPCGCNMFGSSSTQCADSGVCACQDHVEIASTIKCDRCVLHYFGLPDAACQLCACNTTGTVDPALPCDLFSGTCECKPGVTGRQCDQCDFLYTGFGPDGCTTCDECSTVLGNDTLDLTLMFEEYWNLSQVVGEIQQQDLVLMGLMDDINNTVSSLGLSSANLSSLLALAADVTDMEPTHAGIVKAIQTQADQLERVCVALHSDSSAMLDTQSAFLADATAALELGSSTDALATTVQAQFAEYNATAQASLRQVTEEGQTDSVNLNVNFDSERAEAEQTLANLTDIVDYATDLKFDIQVMYNKSVELAAEGEAVNATILGLEQGIANATTTLATIIQATDATQTLYNQTLDAQNYSMSLFAAATLDLQLAQGTLDLANQKSASATADIDDVFEIRDGAPRGVPLPVDPSFNLLGVTSWNNGVERLKQLLIDVAADITAHGDMVTTAETTANTLDAQVQTIVNEFTSVQSRGEAAVEAIQTYQSVASNLATSVEMANQARSTIDDVTTELERVTVAELQQRAADSLATSQELNATVESFSSTPTILAISMNAANNSLHLAAGTWAGIDAALPEFLQTTQAVSDAVSSSTLSQNIGMGFTNLNIATATVSQVSTSDNLTDAPAVNTQQERVAATEATLADSNALLAELNGQVGDLNSLLDNAVQSTLADIQTLAGTTAGALDNVTELLNELEAKVIEAYTLMLDTEQPVRFAVNTYQVIAPEDISDISTQYDEVALEFQYSTNGEGVIFFRENPATDEVITLYMMASELHFRFGTVDAQVDVVSQAELCPGCWFKVTATRYGVEGHLVVQKMSTGGVATNQERGTTATSALVVNDNAYIGGLPDALVTTPKVPLTTGFAGCIWNVKYDDQTLPLWKSVLAADSSASCCARPPTIPGPEMTPGYCFSGFGYVVMATTDISITGSSMVKFQFRSFDADAVFVLVDRAGLSAYWGVFLDGGQMVFEYGTSSSAKTTRRSTGTSYNDGLWHEVTAMHNTSHAQLVVQEVNGTELGAVDIVVDVAAVWDLSEIATEGLMTWGGQNPNTISVTKGPVTGSDSSFAGCLRNMQFARLNSGLVPTDLDLQALATDVSMVSFEGCYTEVIHGLSFMSSSAYARISTTPGILYQLEFDFITYDNTGILVYGTPAAQTSFFYVAMYNGDLQLLFLQSSGAGLQPVLMTHGLYLADGFSHVVHVDFRVQNAPKLRVDGVTHTGSTDSDGYMYVGSGGALYIGGIPSSVNLNSALPVRSSLMGGITRLLLNDGAVNLFTGSTYGSMADLSLCGLPMSPESPPPPPFSTTPAPPTTPAPTCAPPTEPGFSSSGVQFLGNSYVDFSDRAGLFSNSFTIKIRFRTTAPNGLLLYGASGSPNPMYYISLFLSNGHAVASIDTNSFSSNMSPSRTKLVTTTSTFDDGQFHELTLLRINDFMAVVSPNDQAYVNNGASSTTASSLVLSFIYVGGVPPTVAGMPFGAATDIPISSTQGLYGCIELVEMVNRASTNPDNFDVSTGGVNTGAGSCFASEEPGMYLAEAGAYFTLAPQSVVENYKLSLSFKTTARNGTLAAVYVASNAFLLMDMINGNIRISLANAAAPGTPVVGAIDLSGFALCNNDWHTVSFFLRSSLIEVYVDATPSVVGFPSGFVLPTFNNVVVFLGGINDFTRDFGVTWSMQSLPGCIKDVTRTLEDATTVYGVDDFTSLIDTSIGCPV